MTQKNSRFWTVAALCLLIRFPLIGLTQSSSVGSFEIDGNLIDSPSGEPIDWSLDAAGNIPNPALVNRIDFRDGSGQGDDILGQGTKELAPGAWKCLTGSAPSKDDVLKGSMAVRAIGPKRFMYVHFFRAGVNGDVHMDYEFNQSSDPNPACPDLPNRTSGDIVITFDTDFGGAVIQIRAFKWVGDATSGTFTELPLGSKGGYWDGAVNIPNTIPGVLCLRAPALERTSLWRVRGDRHRDRGGRTASQRHSALMSTILSSLLIQPVPLLSCPLAG